MSCDVFVAGSLHLDVVVDAPRMPRIDETLIGSAVAYRFGGKGGNQAVAAARMGAAVEMAGRVGGDSFAGQLLDGLDAAGVGRSAVLSGSGASGMSVAIVDPGGDYGAIVVSAANLAIDAGEISVPEDARVVCLQNEIPEAANLAAAVGAKDAGATVILNAAPSRAFSTALLDHVDVLVVNRVEAGDMSGKTDPEEAAQALTGLGPATVIVTLGSDGLIWCTTATATRTMPAIAVEPVSSHGAGDMFVGAFAARLADGARMENALGFAQAAAALHVSCPVDERARLDRDTVEMLAAEIR
ncbi:PfkB family carbohydrate kinase [Oricola sp.]|uniref:PfkB family carbohydrate kinase n=1 Tax=Oricola sp. TaxID=1979950 RepID=UPI003BAA5AA9